MKNHKTKSLRLRLGAFRETQIPARPITSGLVLLFLAAGSASTWAQVGQANPTAVSLTFSNATTAYSENFNTLPTTGTSTTLPTGWGVVEGGSNGNTTLTAGTGSGTAGDTYSFGTDTDRALGGLRSGTLIPTIGAKFTNNTGLTLVDVTISYRGEEWRLGTASRTDQLDFQYSTSATAINSGTYTDFDALDFVTPSTTGTAGARIGNNAGFFTDKSGTLTALNVANTGSFFIRWNDFDASSADDGLAVDDFSLRVDKLGTNGTSPTLASLAGPATLTIQNGHASTASTLTANVGTSQSFAGILQNGGAAALALTKTGTGTLTLSGANTYTGSTTISAGTLKLTGTGTLGTGNISVGENGTLDVSERASFSIGSGRTLSGTGEVIGDIAVAGTLAPGGTEVGFLTFDDALSLSGTVEIQIASADDYDSLLVGGSLTYGGSLSVAFDSEIEGDFTLFGFLGESSNTFTAVTISGFGGDIELTSGGGWTATEGARTYTFDHGSGKLTVAATAVPEPQEYAVAMAVLLGGLIAMRRRRRHS